MGVGCYVAQVSLRARLTSLQYDCLLAVASRSHIVICPSSLLLLLRTPPYFLCALCLYFPRALLIYPSASASLPSPPGLSPLLRLVGHLQFPTQQVPPRAEARLRRCALARPAAPPCAGCRAAMRRQSTRPPRSARGARAAPSSVSSTSGAMIKESGARATGPQDAASDELAASVCRPSINHRPPTEGPTIPGIRDTRIGILRPYPGRRAGCWGTDPPPRRVWVGRPPSDAVWSAMRSRRRRAVCATRGALLSVCEGLAE